MKRILVLLAVLLVSFSVASAQGTMGSGTINGMKYQTITPPGDCTTAQPCQIMTYLHYFGGENQMAGDLKTFFDNSKFWAANPHTLILAPTIPSATTNNWGGVQPGMSPNMENVIALVKQVESTVPTQTDNVVLTGGSMGGLGTEAGMIQAGPKGTIDPGVFAIGLSYAGADYTAADQQAAKSALCGVNITLVHGTADTKVPYAPDANLAKQLSGCTGFQFVSMQGAQHGVWGSGPQGYANGPLLNQALSAARTMGSNTPATATVAAPPAPAAPPTAATVTNYPASTMIPNQAAPTEAAPAAPAEADPQSDTGGLQAATLKPGGGTVTVDGHEWEITQDGLITEDGREVYASRGTSDMAFVENADGSWAVWGKDDGNGPYPGAWFTISSIDPNAQQRWIVSPTPPAPGHAPVAAPAASPVAPSAVATDPSTVVTSSTPAGACPVPAAGAAGFRVSGGQIIGPNGVFLSRGVNLYSSEANTTDNGKLIVQTFKGVNFIRYIARTLDTPSSYDAFVNEMTSRGVVVEFENHPNGGGGQNLSPPQGMATESAWYAEMAKHFASNPYVWFGTFNEAGTSGGSLSSWQKQTYDAVRSGSDTILLVEVSGVVPAMVPSIFAAMHNIVYDQHIYDNPDQNSLAKIISYDQTVKSADGIVPVIVGEMGPSVPDGSRMAANGIATIEALINIAEAGKMGGLALFTWWPGFANANNLTDPAGNPTVPYGQMAQIYINLDNVPLTDCQLAAGVKQSIADVTAAMTAAAAK